MTASNALKTLFAGLATVAVVGTAVAQGTPPTTASPNAATGAGQQSSQNTPMGTTGTAGGSAGATGAAAGSTTAPSSPSGSTMGSGSSTDTMSGSGGTTARPARADRN